MSFTCLFVRGYFVPFTSIHMQVCTLRVTESHRNWDSIFTGLPLILPLPPNRLTTSSRVPENGIGFTSMFGSLSWWTRWKEWERERTHHVVKHRPDYHIEMCHYSTAKVLSSGWNKKTSHQLNSNSKTPYRKIRLECFPNGESAHTLSYSYICKGTLNANCQFSSNSMKCMAKQAALDGPTVALEPPKVPNC